MRKIIILILVIGVRSQLFGQGASSQNQLTLTKEFVRRVFDMEPFDSISKLTTLNNDLPLRRFKYSAAYFSILILQLQIDKENYPYSDLSYIPYTALSGKQRTLVYEGFMDGIPNGIDLSAIYAVYYKTELVTYVELKNGKINGIKSYYSQGGADYLHQFPMSNIDKDSSMKKLEVVGALLTQTKSLLKEGDLSAAIDFVKFTHDSLLYSRDVKDVKFCSLFFC